MNLYECKLKYNGKELTVMVNADDVTGAHRVLRSRYPNLTPTGVSVTACELSSI